MGLTVITPTYNRAYILGKCYESLCRQTNKDFIWLVVDDGSEDDTKLWVQKWIDDAIINIEYLYKENGGKASALNAAIAIVDTEFAVCLDSDDFFYDNAIELAMEELETLRDIDNCCGILTLRCSKNGKVLGGKEIPSNYMYVNAADIFLKLNLNTELTCFYKSEKLKEYRFPSFEGEKFISPAWMQYKITEKNVFKVSQKKLCCCEYIEDGLTRNKKTVIKRNPRGYSCVKKYSFDLSPNIMLRIKHGIMYNYGCILAKDKDWLKNIKHKKMAFFLYPISFGLYMVKKYKD